MTDWIETYRGTVPPWECDLTEHFTVGRYFDRLEEAEANLAEDLGLGAASAPGNRGSWVAGPSAGSNAKCVPASAFMSRAPSPAWAPNFVSAIASSIRAMARS